METSELRIGNMVADGHKDNQHCTVDAIDLYGGVYTEDKTYDDFQRTIEPIGIPLTERWLLISEFTRQKNDTFSKGLLTIRLKEKDDPFKGNIWIHTTWLPALKVEFVHQLQNLYFALTGEELEFK